MLGWLLLRWLLLGRLLLRSGLRAGSLLRRALHHRLSWATLHDGLHSWLRLRLS